MSTSKKIVLRSSDGKIFEIEKSVAFQMRTIKVMVEDDSADCTVFPVLNVTRGILAKVIEYCKKYVEVSYLNNAVVFEEWKAEFFNANQGVLFDLILAAHHLEIKNLQCCALKAVVSLIKKAKTPEELRKTLNIQSDFTAEEEKSVREAIPWVFE